MALERFRAPALPIPNAEYDQRTMTDIIRALRLYFNQLDSLTPNQAQSYRADNFYGGEFDGTVMTANNVATSTLTATYSNVSSMMSEFIRSKGFLGGNFVGGTFMGTAFYGGTFNGVGSNIVMPHIAASDSTDQLATASDTATLVKWNTLDSGFGWTLNSPGSATAAIAGVYKITYSLQLVNTDNAAHDAAVWLEVNTNNLANSTTIFTVPARKSAGVFSYVCAYSEVVFEVDVGDEIELYWATDQAYDTSPATDGIYIEALAAQASPYVRPATPSAIGSIVYVSASNTGASSTKPKVAPISVTGFGQIGTVIVNTTNTI
jgi:hypothetical protein